MHQRDKLGALRSGGFPAIPPHPLAKPLLPSCFNHLDLMPTPWPTRLPLLGMGPDLPHKISPAGTLPGLLVSEPLLPKSPT